MTLFMGDAVDAAARAHALGVWPRESVGLVLDGVYSPVDNIAADPTKNFEFDSKLMLKPGLQAVIHSHPSPAITSHAPSLLDMQQQMAMNLPWGIVTSSKDHANSIFWWGPGVPIPPLEQRPYRFGPSGTDGRGDCYAIVKDYYQTVKNITLKDVPRDKESFRAQTPWYDSLFSSYGWKEIDPKDMVEGDVVLMRIRQKITNHAMIFMNSGLGLHHAEHMLSARTPIGPWLRFRTRCVRYEVPK
jgi:proteasome lid subunit RPN8/RPN11